MSASPVTDGAAQWAYCSGAGAAAHGASSPTTADAPFGVQDALEAQCGHWGRMWATASITSPVPTTIAAIGSSGPELFVLASGGGAPFSFSTTIAPDLPQPKHAMEVVPGSGGRPWVSLSLALGLGLCALAVAGILFFVVVARRSRHWRQWLRLWSWTGAASHGECMPIVAHPHPTSSTVIPATVSNRAVPMGVI